MHNLLELLQSETIELCYSITELHVRKVNVQGIAIFLRIRVILNAKRLITKSNFKQKRFNCFSILKV